MAEDHRHSRKADHHDDRSVNNRRKPRDNKPQNECYPCRERSVERAGNGLTSSEPCNGKRPCSNCHRATNNDAEAQALCTNGRPEKDPDTESPEGETNEEYLVRMRKAVKRLANEQKRKRKGAFEADRDQQPAREPASTSAPAPANVDLTQDIPVYDVDGTTIAYYRKAPAVTQSAPASGRSGQRNSRSSDDHFVNTRRQNRGRGMQNGGRGKQHAGRDDYRVSKSQPQSKDKPLLAHAKGLLAALAAAIKKPSDYTEPCRYYGTERPCNRRPCPFLHSEGHDAGTGNSVRPEVLREERGSSTKEEAGVKSETEVKKEPQVKEETDVKEEPDVKRGPDIKEEPED
ncbi:hypothetical protein LTR56_009318 [Elasticomyces elasticus]|nr:hypothetical protein LTR56_009318 [Elasticomyces elasticus]KAK3666368.1 hypothetical protein LTR22_002672 [Elasticomyces elasticus]KAK4917747.1 hypothetical protein LTR49_014424 [Elasticomyces elasticus]KAK5766308.1 hypothetical protein LTS12_003519 [Elasticomyces elasticus]